MNNQLFTDANVGRGPGSPASGGLKRGQFTFYASFFEAIDRLPRSRQLETYRAIVDYALNGTEPALNGAPLGLFAAFRPVLDSSRGRAAARLSSNKRTQEE